MVGVEDENLVHRRFDDRIDLIGFGRDAKGHAQEVAGVGQVVLRIEERLSDRIFMRHRNQRRHLGDQPVRRDHALLGIGDIGRVMIE